ncbi:MAG: site-specific integrase [Candidatus Shapirobacteria bacterium]|nr:site-specific integrase [Candidatus Shapirobacteria bacterium]
MDTALNTTLEPFRLWLQNKNLSSSTVRNYVVDVNKYLKFIDNKYGQLAKQSHLQYGQVATCPYTESNLEQYISSISSDPNNSRYLASLNKFCQFALDQKLIKSNPIKKILHRRKSDSQPVLNTENLISQYQKHLIHKNFSQNTIKNYINDIHQFINWAEKNNRPVKGDVT